ncbi:MAG: type II toxin-antitoxin system PemK/MazF family toxin [Oscillospiraceae bacterium]|nr:type II toxin-antitoxin system PemK/MazF family toxin [Oscillospiraceae bacterium]
MILIYYKGRSGNCKVRPVLVLNTLNNGWCTIVEITSVAPKNPPGYYDLFKEPILKWKECGLDEPSYVKCNSNNIHNVEEIRLRNKIGKVDYNDFINIVDKIVNL